MHGLSKVMGFPLIHTSRNRIIDIYNFMGQTVIDAQCVNARERMCQISYSGLSPLFPAYENS